MVSILSVEAFFQSFSSGRSKLRPVPSGLSTLPTSLYYICLSIPTRQSQHPNYIINIIRYMVAKRQVPFLLAPHAQLDLTTASCQSIGLDPPLATFQHTAVCTDAGFAPSFEKAYSLSGLCRERAPTIRQDMLA